MLARPSPVINDDLLALFVPGQERCSRRESVTPVSPSRPTTKSSNAGAMWTLPVRGSSLSAVLSREDQEFVSGLLPAQHHDICTESMFCATTESPLDRDNTKFGSRYESWRQPQLFGHSPAHTATNRLNLVRPFSVFIERLECLILASWPSVEPWPQS